MLSMTACNAFMKSSSCCQVTNHSISFKFGISKSQCHITELLVSKNGTCPFHPKKTWYSNKLRFLWRILSILGVIFFHFGTSLWKSISNLNWVAKTSGNFFGGQNEGTKFWPNVLTGYIFLFYWHILQVPGFWTITIYMVDSFKSIMNWIHPCKLLPLACTVGPKNTCRFSSGVYWLQTFPGEFEILGVTISLSDKESLLDKTSWPVRHVLSFIPKLFVSYTIYIYIYIHITILK